MEERFIEEVRKYVCLYNVHCKDYRDQRKRQVAWEEVGKKIHKPWHTCRDDWTKLRNAYTNALKRRRSINGQSAKKYLKWKFEDQMAFLSPFMESRSSQSNINYQNDNSIESQIEEKHTVDDGTKNEYVDEEWETSTPTCSVPGTSAQDANDTDDKGNVGSFCRPETSEMRLDNPVTQLVDLPAQTNIPGDDIDLFFLSLAKSMKKLPQAEQVRLKMGISNLVFEAELRNISTVTHPKKPE